MREIRMLRSMWRGLETESRSDLHGHERGNPGYSQDHDLRTTPRQPSTLPRVSGTHRVDDESDYGNEHFELAGHILSSLEHEVWQQITGFDAISAVRGIQLALAAGSDLLEVRSDGDSFESYLSDSGVFLGSPNPAKWDEEEHYHYEGDIEAWLFDKKGSGRKAFVAWVEHDRLGYFVWDTDGDPIGYESDLNIDDDGFAARLDSYDAWVSGLDFPCDSELFANEPYCRYARVPLEVCRWENDINDPYPADHFFRYQYSSAVEDCWRSTISDIHDRSRFYDFWDTKNYQGEPLAFGLQRSDYRFADLGSGEFPGQSGYDAALFRLDYLVALERAFRSVNARDWLMVLSIPSEPPEYAGETYRIHVERLFAEIEPGRTDRKLTNLVFPISNISWAAGGAIVSAEAEALCDPEHDVGGKCADPARRGGPDNHGNVNNGACAPATDDPIAVVTGNMYHDETDFLIPGRSLDFIFTRTYNSRSSLPGHEPLGRGWTHSYNMHLRANDYGDNPAADGSLEPENDNGKTSSITYINERGGAVNFLVDDDGSSPSYAVTPPVGVFDELALDSPAPGKATITFVNGVQYIFEGGDLTNPGEYARIAQIISPEGDSLNFTYQSGKLAKIDEGVEAVSAGRTGIEFFYDQDGMLQAVEDWTDRRWEFGYGESASVDFVDVDLLTSSMDGVRHVSTADIDGDSDLDILVANEDGPNATWFENEDGLGRSWDSHEVSSRKGASSIATGDFDGDGDLDLLTTAWSKGNAVDRFMNNGGGLSWSRSSGSGNNPVLSVDSADFNLDGVDDRLVGHPDHYIAWFTGEGTPPQYELIEFSTQYSHSDWVVAVDINLDGQVDVVAAAKDTSDVAWYENSDDGTEWTTSTFPHSGQGVYSITAADISGDAKPELVIGLDSPDEIVVFGQDGANWVKSTVSDTETGPAWVSTADVDSDGDVDIVAAIDDSDSIVWFESDSGGWSRHEIVVPGAPIELSSIHAADLDFDGLPEVMYTDFAADSVYIARQAYRGAQPLRSVTTPSDDTTSYEYDTSSGHLNLVRSPQERDGQFVETHFSYFRNGRAFSDTNSYGDGETLDYDFYRGVTRVEGFRNEVREFYFDRAGLLTTLHEGDGSVRSFGHTVEYQRDSRSNGLGQETEYSYQTNYEFDGEASNAMGLVTAERDPRGHVKKTDYNADNRIERIVGKNGGVLELFYYPDSIAPGAFEGKLERIEIAELRSSDPSDPPAADVELRKYTYFANGNVDSIVEYFDAAKSKSRTTTYVYNESGLNPAEIVPEKITVTGSDGPEIVVTRTIDGLGRVTASTLKRRTSYDDPTMIDATTSYGYDALGRVEVITDPNLNQVEFIYDANGMVVETRRRFWLEATSEYGSWESISKRTYDLADRMVEERDINDELTSFEYDGAGNATNAVGPTGVSVSFEYDLMNRLTAVTNESGFRAATHFDAAGRPVSSVDPTGVAISRGFDASGNVVSLEDPLGQAAVFDYDAVGNVETVINANAEADASLRNAHSASQFNEYDELGRLIRAVDAYDEETRFEYDLLGNVTAVIDAETNRTSFEYDGLGRLRKTIDPLLNETTYEHDEAGNRIYMMGRDGVEEVTIFDLLNRPTGSRIVDASNTVTWAYDEQERLETVGNPDVTYTFGYDAKGRLTSRTDSRLSAQPVTYEYDAADRLTAKTDYQGDRTEFDYDATGRLVGERNAEYLQVSYQYDGAGRVLRRILSNGARTEYGYDPAGRLDELVNLTADGTELERIRIIGAGASPAPGSGRDAVGNVTRTETTRSDGSAEVATYDYDRLHRLVEAVYVVDDVEQERQTFSYDDVGNRKTSTSTLSGLPIQHYLYNANNQLVAIRLNSETGTLHKSFEYDLHGNLTKRRNDQNVVELELHYDKRGRVTSADVNGTEVAQYRYDPFGYRIETVTAAGTRRSFLDGEHLEAACDDQGNIRAKYLRGTAIDEVVNAYHYDENGEPTNLTYHHDALQTVVGLSGHAGTVEETLQYGAFGDLLSSTGSSPSTLRFTGRESNADTVLYYYRARYYDPEIGRFLSEDPLGFGAGDVNLYAYVGNNPVNWTDPSGLSWRRGLSKAAEIFGESVEKINNRRPLNWRFSVDGIPKSIQDRWPDLRHRGGRPDFSAYADESVTLKGLTGKYSTDSRLANHAAGREFTPDDMVWHHVDETTMQLIPKDLHNALRHTGGAAMLRRAGSIALAFGGGILTYIRENPAQAAEDLVLPISSQDVDDFLLAAETIRCKGFGWCSPSDASAPYASDLGNSADGAQCNKD